jgi:hypothetical protein
MVIGKILGPKKITSSLILLAVLICPWLPSQEQPKDWLILHGDRFRFGVKEPAGWQGDWERASNLKSNIIFYQKGHDMTTAYGVIRVRINNKKNEDTGADLAVDMEGYRKQFAAIIFQDLEASHPLYPCYPKLFCLEGKFHEYVAYLNPGKDYWYMFSVAMNTRDKIATESELLAFRTVVSSLLAIDAAGSSGQPSSDFDAALRTADDNLKSKDGERYDVTFARKAAGSWLASALPRCTRGLPNADLGPFTVLVRVGSSGKPEEVLVRPLTKVAQCLKPLFASAKHPKPPGPSWWVKMDIAIR